MKDRKGIILSGGTGSRLYPITNVNSKQLLPIYSKPMVYYSLSTLMLANIRSILIIVNPQHLELFQNLLGDGSSLGIELQYIVQEYPSGIAEAFRLGEHFINNHPSMLILGDNLFYGSSFLQKLEKSSSQTKGATVFLYRVQNPSQYGIAELSINGEIVGIEEKPVHPKTNYAITGIYFYDQDVVYYSKQLRPSQRNELEITDLNHIYLKKNLLFGTLDSEYVWFDMGTYENMYEANNFVRSIEMGQDIMVACPEEIAYNKGWITATHLDQIAISMTNSIYGQYLSRIVNKK